MYVSSVARFETGDIIWSDPERDLAIVDVAVPEGHPTAVLSCIPPHPGQHVMSVGPSHPISMGAGWGILAQ